MSQIQISSNEEVLVVNAQMLQEYISEGGLKVTPIVNSHIHEINKLIQTNGVFLSRSKVEDDCSYKQIIPYVYITYCDSIFLTNRKKTQSEIRLHNKYSLGVGGHINKLDSSKMDNIIYNGMLRELYEEVIIGTESILRIKPQFLISDNTTEVGIMHIGIVYHLQLNSNECSVNETNKMEGRWIKINDLCMYYDRLESWSQIIADALLVIDI